MALPTQEEDSRDGSQPSGPRVTQRNGAKPLRLPPRQKPAANVGLARLSMAASRHRSHLGPQAQPCRPLRASAVLRRRRGTSGPSALFTWSQGRGQAGRAREHAGDDAGHRAFPPGSSRDSEATSGSRGLRRGHSPPSEALSWGKGGRKEGRDNVAARPPPNTIHNPADRKGWPTSLPAVSLGNVPLPTCCGNLCFSLLKAGEGGDGFEESYGEPTEWRGGAVSGDEGPRFLAPRGRGRLETPRGAAGAELRGLSGSSLLEGRPHNLRGGCVAPPERSSWSVRTV